MDVCRCARAVQACRNSCLQAIGHVILSVSCLISAPVANQPSNHLSQCVTQHMIIQSMLPSLAARIGPSCLLPAPGPWTLDPNPKPKALQS